MKKQTFSILLCLLTVALAVCFARPVTGSASDTQAAVLVSATGEETPTEDPLNAFVSGTHSYVKLYGDLDLGTMDGQVLWLDLNGKDLTVTGTGTLHVFDSANDTYDAEACGSVTNHGTVAITPDLQAPNGSRYIAVTDGTTTMHRLDMGLTAVSLRTTAAGIYYKAVYNCDDVLEAKAKYFGVVLSIDNMPGADFLTETGDINCYTKVTGFKSGVIATSGSVFGIMKEDRTVAANAANGETPIYANPYVNFDLNGGTVCVGDTQNGNKTKTEGFTGRAYSLHDVMDMLDEAYFDYSAAVRVQIDDFYYTWKDKGMDWSFVNIGKSSRQVDNSDLPEDPDYCPVCQTTVTWVALTDDTQNHTLQDGQHYYLTKPLTYTGTEGSGFIIAPGKNETACLHLNGQSITATKDHAIYGNSGVLNVMGEGQVSGYTATAHYGGAVQVNNTNARSAVNLYGGIYRKTDDSAATAASIFIRHNGGAVNLYRGVQIGTGTGEAICVGKSNYRDSVLGALGAEVKGDIYLYGADPDNGNASRITLIDATVSGTVQVNANNDVTLGGVLKVATLSLAEDVLVSTKSLKAGTAIGVDAEGIFTKASPSISRYLEYFTPVQTGYVITVKNDALRCSMNYTGDLKLTDGQAYCPVCRDTVTWEELTDDTARQTLQAGKHYYLSKSLTYETAFSSSAPSFVAGPGGGSACLHLNGNDITATQAHALYAGSGILNVMGSGIVTGCAEDYRYGGALVCNTTNTGSVVNLYGGTYKRTDNSASKNGETAYVLSVRNNGGTLNLYEDVTVETSGTGNAIYVGTSKQGNSNLSLNGATVNGNIWVRERVAVDTYDTNITVDSAVITGTVKIDNTDNTDWASSVILQNRPVIGKLTVPEGFLVTLEDLKEGTSVAVDATGIFTNHTDNAQTWANWFTASEATNWIVVREKALCCTGKQTLSNGKKVIFLGNSRTYYGKCVLEKGQTVYSQEERSNDQGYFYQICKANGVDVNVTNYTFGGHSLVDFYSEDCQADRGHNGHNHLADITDWNYDYVILQDGSRSNNGFTSALEQCQKLMELFRAGNPNTKFVYLVHNVVHSDSYVWRSTIKELEDAGILVVDWGELVDDLINGVATIPNGTQTCSKYSFIVNKSETDGHHPNVLTGYITAQMLYCALTEESAVGQDYSFWNDPKANAAFDMEAYKETYYAYDATVDSGTNFEAIFGSSADMVGLQQLMDQYFAAKGYRDY